MHKPVLFVNDVSTNREGAVSINVLFSSENVKNSLSNKRMENIHEPRKSLQKVPIVVLTLHVMPRTNGCTQTIFGQIPIIAWPLPGIT